MTTPGKKRKKINSFRQSFKASGKEKGEKPDFTIYKNIKRERYHTNCELGTTKDLKGINEM